MTDRLPKCRYALLIVTGPDCGRYVSDHAGRPVTLRTSRGADIARQRQQAQRREVIHVVPVAHYDAGPVQSELRLD